MSESILRYLLVSNNYDSVSNLISMYDAYARSDGTLYGVFEKYRPPIVKGRETCVGLAMELIRRWSSLEKRYPGIAEATGMVSCEEAVLDVEHYVGMGEDPMSVGYAEKEHVLVCVQVIIDGRPGVLLADPGYHLSRIVTVMHDLLCPHTDWLIQSEEPQCRKEFKYNFNQINSNYIEWHERTTKGAAVKYQTSLIYAAQPFLESITLTEKRNLVYTFRSLLARDKNGRSIAGMYFPITSHYDDAGFTIFVDNGIERRRTKYKFSAFKDPGKIHKSVLDELEKVSLKLKYKKRELLKIIVKLSKVMCDKSFVQQLLEINDDICRMYL